MSEARCTCPATNFTSCPIPGHPRREPIKTYTHWEAAKLNATSFVTLGDYQRLREVARAVVDARDNEDDLEVAIDVLLAEAVKPTV